MARNDAPGTRTTDLLPPLPDLVHELVAEAGAQELDLAALVPDPQDAPLIRWGILGAGGIAGRFATDVPNLSSGVIAAVGSRDRSKAQTFIDAHPGTGKGGAARAHGSYEELVADPEVDAVYVATPHMFHAEQALLALRAGKPVLVEKSFTVNASQAREVLDLAQSQGLFAMEAMWTRFLPGQVVLRALAGSGALGRIRNVRADHYQALLHVPRLVCPELAGGALLDLGVYSVSFVHSLLGAPEAVRVLGRLSRKGVDLDEVVAMGYPGATAAASAGMDCSGTNTAQVVGDRARVDLSPCFYTPTPLTVSRRSGDGSGTAATWDASVPGGFQLEAAEAARCIAAGRTQSEIMPWSATLEVMELMDQVRRDLGVVYPGE
ncbi:Gfo/Idh/MocA family protein [Actinomyces faecalis]|uniref:Gfo/Idh/MocA family protein n=1 Tax=Actinomyces faecalis TaxID=2722820 RepID=UPI0015538505|nr:Gfo/Idh/MocA family oxidoreductase [Actinomyces faecalis]